jgi:dCMP deaminase
MKPKFIKAYMKVAKVFSELSTAKRLHVGAIIVKDNRIISLGYNGMPSGWSNQCEYETYETTNSGETHIVIKTRPEVLHAEMNALMKLARSTESGEGASMFITHSPCMDCAKGIYQSGIKKVYFGEQYRESTGLEFLKKCNIAVEQIDV